MFLSSVFVPSSGAPARRIETLASQRRLPSSMFTSETPSCLTVVRRSCAHSRASAGPRRSGSVTISTSGVPAAVEVDQRGGGAVDPARLADVDHLRRVLLEVDAVDANVAQPPARGQRDVVLADLVALRVVGIEVVLAVEDRPRGDLALERQGDLQRVADRLLVDHRQRARVRQADRAGVDVRLVAERERAAAEHLRPRRELDVDLQADHGLVAVGHQPVVRGFRLAHP